MTAEEALGLRSVTRNHFPEHCPERRPERRLEHRLEHRPQIIEPAIVGLRQLACIVSRRWWWQGRPARDGVPVYP